MQVGEVPDHVKQVLEKAILASLLRIEQHILSAEGTTVLFTITPNGAAETPQDKTDTRSLKNLAAEALQVQDACNLSGVVHGWSRSITRLRELFPTEGTLFFNHHPISRLWASKVHSLTGMGISSSDRFAEAYHACQELAGVR